MSSTFECDKQFVANTYNRFPVEIVSGKGSTLVDADGKEYIDLGAGIAVSAFGISDSAWVEAVTKQINAVQHTSNLYYTKPCSELAELICEKTGMSKVFFGNSGAEANECVIKVARKYGEDVKGIENPKILTLWNSFHGRTLATLAATGQDHYHEQFKPMPEGFVHANANDLEQTIEVAKANNVVAILIECVQGEGGVIPLDREYIEGIYKYCQENDVLMAVDEVQTGNGRTGKLYAWMNFDIKPDLFSTAKGLGGGLPIGACVMGEKVANILGPGDHGSTFGGNPVCCAGAITIINRLSDVFLSGVTSKSAFIRSMLEGQKGIEAVTGMGLMLGLKTTRPASDVVKECIEEGVLCLTAKDKVRLTPALNISTELLEKAAVIIRDVCARGID